MPTTDGRYRLYFFFLDGCPHCEAAWPTIEAYAKRHPEVPVQRLDLSTVEWKAKRWSPRVTPTIVVLRPHEVNGSRFVYWEGWSDDPGQATEFLAWLSGHIPHGW